MTGRVVVLVLTATALAGCSSSHGSRTQRVVVSPRGRIGPLRVGDSDRAAVISFAGRPESERHGHYSSAYDSLGYGCRGKPATDNSGLPHCTTVYSGFRFDTKWAFLVMWLAGGRKILGDHVGFLVVHSQHLNPGVFDCIDS